jgi:hypothetical protein
MPSYSASGEENLRADPNIYVSPGDKSPSYVGKDAGGDETNATTLSATANRTPDSYSHDVPPGLQSFDDNGQKDGGTKYMGS